MINLMLVFFSIISTSYVYGFDNVFDLEDLEVGKSVTLPTPATTVFSATSEVRLSSTDKSQIVKIALFDVKVKESIKIAIYDSNSAGVHYVKIDKDMPALYNFHELSTIQIVPKPIASTSHLKLIVESNKPLGITR